PTVSRYKRSSASLEPKTAGNWRHQVGARERSTSATNSWPSPDRRSESESRNGRNGSPAPYGSRQRPRQSLTLGNLDRARCKKGIRKSRFADARLACDEDYAPSSFDGLAQEAFQL